MVLEYRLEQTKKQVVVIANERDKRPVVYAKGVQCPFDKGAENTTPPTKLALPSEKNWTVRAFDNAFAFLKRRGKFVPQKGNYWTSPAVGDHEVIVETDKHGALYHELGEEQLMLVFDAYRARFHAPPPPPPRLCF